MVGDQGSKIKKWKDIRKTRINREEEVVESQPLLKVIRISKPNMIMIIVKSLIVPWI